jgi:hypothetical protein
VLVAAALAAACGEHEHERDGEDEERNGAGDAHERTTVEPARRFHGYVFLYSGPEPPSGGVSRPPFAVIAPHWTQFDGVT